MKEVMIGVNYNKKRDIANLLEDMMKCDDVCVQELVVIAVLESVLAERDFVENIRSDLGVKTQEHLKFLEIRYGWI